MTSSKAAPILTAEELQALLDAAEYAQDHHDKNSGFFKAVEKAINTLYEQTQVDPAYYCRGDLRD